jgi:hypothetical protein
MKRLALGAAATGGAVFALRRLTRHARKLHEQCRQMMRDHCGGSIPGHPAG